MDSIRFGPHFADAYSSLASLYAEQVKCTPSDIHTHIRSMFDTRRSVVTLLYSLLITELN